MPRRSSSLVLGFGCWWPFVCCHKVIVSKAKESKQRNMPGARAPAVVANPQLLVDSGSAQSTSAID